MRIHVLSPLVFAFIFVSVVISGWCGRPVAGGIATSVATVKAPDELVIEDEAPTLIDFLHKEKPAIWAISDDCCHLLHVKATSDTVEFVASATYRFKHKGRLVWGKISDKNKMASSNRTTFTFLRQKFVTEKLRDSREYNPDGNHSSFTLLSSDNGRRLYNVSCASLGGGRAHQEVFWSCLVYVDAKNTPHLACDDGFSAVVRKSGTMSIGHSDTDIKVIWQDKTAAPFTVTFVSATNYCYPAEDIETYAELREGLIAGELPMYRKVSAVRYVESDGKRTPRDMAYLLSRYESQSIHDVDDRTKRIWLEAFRKANPTLKTDKVLPKGTKVTMPVKRKVQERLKQGT